MICFIDYSGEV